MSTRKRLEINGLALLPVLLFAWPAVVSAQVPVDDNGQPIGEYSTAGESPATGNEDIPLLTATELEELIGPIALYPDDLLAIVLPASAYPLQIVQAGRFLDALENDPELEPDESWDDSVVALINYPEVVRLLNDDLDWTWRLGEAVVAQQADVIAAVEAFRDRAYAAGNLKSDERQTVSRDEGYIEITPVDDDVIYVPYYEPERVVVYQPRPVYYYYPDPCPVYYYPYPSSYAFHRGFFSGVTTAFTVGWRSDRLHVFHHSYRGHPYYGRYYWPRWRYRQPTINVYNNIYVNRYANRSRNYYRSGDYWRPRDRRTVRIDNHRVTRTRQYPSDSINSSRSRNDSQAPIRSRTERSNRAQRLADSDDFKFRERPGRTAAVAEQNRSTDRRTTDRRSVERRATERRGTESRAAERRPIEQRITEPRANERRSVERRTTQPRTIERRPVERRDTSNRVRQDAYRTDVRQPRQNTAHRSEPRHTERRRTESKSKPKPKSKRSGTVKIAEGSRKDRVRSRDRRH